MAINVSVQYNGGFTLDNILSTLSYSTTNEEPDKILNHNNNTGTG